MPNKCLGVCLSTVASEAISKATVASLPPSQIRKLPGIQAGQGTDELNRDSKGSDS